MSAAAPEISVVMGVYNSVDTLDAAMASVLAQGGVELELIVVDDGSSDGSGEALDRWAQLDPRVVVLHQQNTGLTIALQRGCAIAKGEFIARQDAGGDQSLPGRLQAQRNALRANPAAVAVSGPHRLVAMDGTVLCEVRRTREQIKAGLTALELPGIAGILHPSSMFRADAFRKVGGYRQMFVVAQDVDLWLRLFEIGEFEYVDVLLYDMRHDPGSISAVRNAEQLASAAFAGACARARRSGNPEPVPSGERKFNDVGPISRTQSLAAYHYFVGSCLSKRDARQARGHFLRAWRARPAMLKALLRAATTW